MKKIFFVAVVLFSSLIIVQLAVLKPALSSSNAPLELIPALQQVKDDCPIKVFEDSDVEVYLYHGQYFSKNKKHPSV
jgi:hypothetical protein